MLLCIFHSLVYICIEYSIQREVNQLRIQQKLFLLLKNVQVFLYKSLISIKLFYECCNTKFTLIISLWVIVYNVVRTKLKIFMNISMNANIMKILSITIKVTCDHFYVIERLCGLPKAFRSANLIITLAYVLVDNFCHCFLIYFYFIL